MPCWSRISASASPQPSTTDTASDSQRASSRIFDSLLMSIRHPVSWTASRTFWPLRPIASESWSSGTITSIERCASSMITFETAAGESAEQT